MIPLLAPHHAVLKLNTRLYLNCLADVDDETAGRRPSGATNSLAFLALHLLDSRCYLARFIGSEAGHPFEALLEGVRGIEEMSGFPPLAEVRAAWERVSATLADRLAALTEEEVLRESPQRFPVDDRTVLGAVAFLLQHDSYHVGQMALLRKYFGLPPMSYS
jgi:uncharacterized damage-inducible protein DinB